MNCSGTPATPGVDYNTDTFTAGSSNLTGKCAGAPVGITVTVVAGGYVAFFPAAQVKCPGPIEVFENGELRYCAKVTPCN